MPPNLSTIRQVRRGVVLIVAAATTVFAVTLIVHALSPRGLGLAPTSQLLGILALLTLPACTIAAWAWDRSVRKRTAGHAITRVDADPDDPNRTREHPAGRVRPHEAAAMPADFETPADQQQVIEAKTTIDAKAGVERVRR